MDAASLVTSLSRTIDDTVGTLISDGPLALVDFPGYGNVGDHAVWLGARACLKRRDRPLTYVCSEDSYDRRALGRAVGAGTIVLSGGGNFGDLYPRHQRLREQILDDFPLNRVVQLPQSIEYRDAGAARRTREVLDRHPDFTLLVREERSAAKAAEFFPSTPCLLCPDMSLALGTLDRPVAPTVDLLVLRRRDAEAAAGVHATPQAIDWRRSAVLAGLSLAVRSAAPRFAKDALLGTISRSYLRRGCRTLARGRRIVTDRLHAHLLALAMGIPHVLCDNSYGKVRSVFETWTSRCPIVSWASSWDEAIG